MNTYVLTIEQLNYIIERTTANALQCVSNEMALVLDGNSSTDTRDLLGSIKDYLEIEAESIIRNNKLPNLQQEPTA